MTKAMKMPAPFKKILIVSASVGSGHNQAANAMSAELKRRYPGVRVRVADFMGEGNSYMNSLVKETYLKMISLSPNIYDLLYRWSQSSGQFSKVQNIIARAMKRSLLRLYIRHRPDLIIFTHPFPCGAAAYLRRGRRIDVPLVGIITDFAVHPLWVYDEVDQYFVAGEPLRDALVRQGVPAGRIHCTGIPISANFTRVVDRAAVAANLGLDPAEPIVLVMGGGLGVGPVEAAVRALDDSRAEFQMIVVAGRNADLRRQLQAAARASRRRMIILGYTHRVRELMAAADLLVTKPGALTLSEAMAAGLPMLLINPIPGQEEENADYLVSQGAAIRADDVDKLAVIAAGVLAEKEALARMRRSAARLAQPQAAANAARIIGRLAARPGAAAGS